MFKTATYQGKSVILTKMVQFKISQDTLDIVQKIGPSKFIKLAKANTLIDTVLAEYAEWFITCPDSVKDILCNMFNRQFYEVNDEMWLVAVCMHIAVSDFEMMINTAPEWYNYAPKNFIFIIEKALSDGDVLDFNPSVAEAVANYLGEAVDVAKYAALI